MSVAAPDHPALGRRRRRHPSSPERSARLFAAGPPAPLIHAPTLGSRDEVRTRSPMSRSSENRGDRRGRSRALPREVGRSGSSRLAGPCGLLEQVRDPCPRRRRSPGRARGGHRRSLSPRSLVAPQWHLEADLAPWAWGPVAKLEPRTDQPCPLLHASHASAGHYSGRQARPRSRTASVTRRASCASDSSAQCTPECRATFVSASCATR
jgi:hypothetical protein